MFNKIMKDCLSLKAAASERFSRNNAEGKANWYWKGEEIGFKFIVKEKSLSMLFFFLLGAASVAVRFAREENRRK